jgi:hypothetical protein
MGGRGSSYISKQTSEDGLRNRAEGIRKILNESGMPVKKSMKETVEMLRKRDRDNGLVFNKKPDPDNMTTSQVYREIDRLTNKMETTYMQYQIDGFKKNYNIARSKYYRGDVAGAEKSLAKIPYDYIRYKALDESMYGDFQNKKRKEFYKKYH